jgi:hypothetical protein
MVLQASNYIAPQLSVQAIKQTTLPSSILRLLLQKLNHIRYSLVHPTIGIHRSQIPIPLEPSLSAIQQDFPNLLR